MYDNVLICYLNDDTNFGFLGINELTFPQNLQFNSSRSYSNSNANHASSGADNYKIQEIFTQIFPFIFTHIKESDNESDPIEPGDKIRPDSGLWTNI